MTTRSKLHLNHRFEVVQEALSNCLLVRAEGAVTRMSGNSPVKGFAYEAARFHGLHEHEHLEVRHVLDLIVLRLEEVLLRDKDTLFEEVRVNR